MGKQSNCFSINCFSFWACLGFWSIHGYHESTMGVYLAASRTAAICDASLCFLFGHCCSYQIEKYEKCLSSERGHVISAHVAFWLKICNGAQIQTPEQVCLHKRLDVAAVRDVNMPRGVSECCTASGTLAFNIFHYLTCTTQRISFLRDVMASCMMHVFVSTC